MAYASAALILILLVFAGLKNSRAPLYAVVFLSAWGGVEIDVGLRVTAYTIAVIALLLVVLFRSAFDRIKMPYADSQNPWLLVFITYCCALSFIQSFFLPGDLHQGLSMRAGQLRAFSQILMFGLSVIPVIFLSRIVRHEEYIDKCAKIYLLSVMLLAALGYLQLTVWYATGSDPFPIGIVNSLLTGAQTRSGVDWVDGSAVYRMSSFSGEPKSLATSLVVGLLLIQVGKANHKWSRKQKRKANVLWVFLAMAVILTWSTSGAFLWLIGTLALSFFGSGDILRARVKKAVIPTILLLFVFGGGGYLIISDLSDGSGAGKYATVAENRFVNRSPIEDFDETVLHFLKDHPEEAFLGVGLGNIHSYAAPYIPRFAKHYMEGSIFVAKSGYLRLISEIGVVGFILFSVAYVWPLSRLMRISQINAADPEYRRLVELTCTFALVMYVMAMARTYVWPQMYVTFGLVLSHLAILRGRTTQQKIVSDSRLNALIHSRSAVRETMTGGRMETK